MSIEFGRILICLKKKGIDASRAIPLSGDDPFDRFTVDEDGKIHTFRQRDFLEYAKQKGCYQEEKKKSN